MANSHLVSYTKISPNRTSPRKSKIDTITIHCTAGQTGVEALGTLFGNPTRKASSNYGIGKDGKIAMYVEEADRSWCSSNVVNDNRAITIECSSESREPYIVADCVLDSLVDLCADICRRNGIERLVWGNTKDSRVNHRNGCNMTVHRDFAAKACPGQYLMERMPWIAEQVNERLSVNPLKDRLLKVADELKAIAEAL